MTEQQLIEWARSLSFWQAAGLIAFGQLVLVAVFLLGIALSSLLPASKGEYIEGGEEDEPFHT